MPLGPISDYHLEISLIESMVLRLFWCLDSKTELVLNWRFEKKAKAIEETAAVKLIISCAAFVLARVGSVLRGFLLCK